MIINLFQPDQEAKEVYRLDTANIVVKGQYFVATAELSRWTGAYLYRQST